MTCGILFAVFLTLILSNGYINFRSLDTGYLSIYLPLVHFVLIYIFMLLIVYYFIYIFIYLLAVYACC